MIVVDASVVVEFLLGEPLNAIGSAFADVLRADPPQPVGAPHLLDAEVGQTLRRYERRGEMDSDDARATLADLGRLPVTRYPHAGLLDRAFDLRANVTMYDALYLALAEATRAEFLTADGALVDVPGCQAQVRLLPGQ